MGGGENTKQNQLALSPKFDLTDAHKKALIQAWFRLEVTQILKIASFSLVALPWCSDLIRDGDCFLALRLFLEGYGS